MRIVFVINNLGGGGAERVVCTLSAHLRAQGHNVTIVTLHGGARAYSLPDDVEVIDLWSRALLRGAGRVAFLPAAALELERLLRWLAPDATMSFLTRSNLAHILTRALGNRKPIYISERTVGNAYAPSRGARLLGRAVARLYPWADHIVAISDGVKDSLAQAGVPREIITTIYNPQDIAGITAVAERVRQRARPSGPFSIVMAGRLSPEKDYPTMLEAIASLVHKRRRDVRLVVLGQGPEEAPLRRLAADLDVVANVDWRGWVTNVHEVMAECDAFAFTSRWEGFGNVLVEAMACGLPVISTRARGGPLEIMEEHGKYGFLVECGDVPAIADAVERLMNDPGVRAEYRDRALAGAGRFDVSRIAEQYMRVLTGG